MKANNLKGIFVDNLIMKTPFFLYLFLSLASCAFTTAKNDRIPTSLGEQKKEERKNEVTSVIRQLRSEIEQLKISSDGPNDEYFDLTAYLGPHYTSMYFLSLQWSGDLEAKKEYQSLAHEFTQLLYSLQLPNGSWYRVLDKNLADPGDLSATLMNYWFLKSVGENPRSEKMLRARAYIMDHGGLEKVDMLTKVFMALFNNYSWEKIPSIPYLLFSQYSPVSVKSFGAWMGPHIMPIAILRKIKSQKESPQLSLAELQNSAQDKKRPSSFPQRLAKSDQRMMLKLMDLQRPRGSWGGYVIASIFSKMALVHYLALEYDQKNIDRAAVAHEKAQHFLDSMLFFPKANRLLGPTQDGHVWDTALITGALIDAGAKGEEVASLTGHLKKFQRPNGGFPFGYDFEETPDVDDTVEIVSTLARVNQEGAFNETIERALGYVKKMQNRDGGFAAFSKNNDGNFLLTFLTRAFQDSADLYDESSPDVTGHVLEAIGKSGMAQGPHSNVVALSIKYLRKAQHADGSFDGRWAINSIYGTSASIVGLMSVGVSPLDPMVEKAMDWLKKQANPDGGFGEGTSSYKYPEERGRGVSTPSQTAWALSALLKVLPASDPTVLAAVDFLVQNFRENKTFVDSSVTGTGHPNACYMVYPAYAKAFPLTALSLFLKMY